MTTNNGIAPARSIPIVTMTPEWAASLLSHNAGNRAVRRTRIDRYIRDMKAGRWAVTGDAIVVDTNGNLAQGQHRLIACVESGCSFDVPFLEGADPQAWNVMDTGVARTLGDVLRRRGSTAASADAAAINAILRWSAGAMTTAWTLSHQEGIDFADANPEYEAASRRGLQFRRGDIKGWNAPSISALSFYTNQYDSEAADEFFDVALKGTGLYDGHPILALRRWTARAAESSGHLDRTYALAIYVKTWNAFITQRSISILAWKRGGGEDFPILKGSDGKPIPLTYKGPRVELARRD